MDFGFPHQLLHGIFCVEAIVPKDLHSIGGHLVGNGGVEGVLVARIHLPGCPLVAQPGQLHLRGHLCQQESHSLVLGQWRVSPRGSCDTTGGRSFSARDGGIIGVGWEPGTTRVTPELIPSNRRKMAKMPRGFACICVVQDKFAKRQIHK